MSDLKDGIIAALATVVVRGVITEHRNRRAFNALAEENSANISDFNELLDQAKSLGEDYDRSVATTRYLASIIDRNGIEIDEFDQIAITNPFLIE